MKSNFFGVSVSLAALILSSAMAHAQEAPPESADQALEAGEIVVTANRESSLLSKTPVALTAIGGEALVSAGVNDPTDLGNVTPNLSIDRDPAPASGGGLQITIRGITSTDATEKGDPSAAFLLDGIYIARQQAQAVSFFDIERIEVLRGPQGTLYGRNTTAGVIHLISVKPKDEFGVSASLGYGSFNAIEATGTINVPVSDGFSIRAAVNHERRDNTVIPTVSTVDIDPFRNNTSLRLSALIEPSDRLSIYLSGDYSWIKGSPFGVVPVTNFFPGPLVSDTTPVYSSSSAKRQRSTDRFIPQEEYRDNKDRGVMAEVNYDLDIAKLVWLSSYREFDREENFHSGPTATFRNLVRANYWQHSEELRLALGGNSWWKAQLGGYYFKEKSAIDAIVVDIDRGFFQDPTISISKAAFAQATLTLADGLNLTGGVRYSHDRKSREGILASDPLGSKTPIQFNSAKRGFSKTTWRLGLDYDVPDLGLLYATVSTGYKAGGFNDGCLIGDGPSCSLTDSQLYYAPETLTSFEAGFKWRLLDNALRVNGSVFHYDYKGLQLSQASTCSGTPCQVTSNAGKSKIDGVELEAVIRPQDGHQIDLGLNWLDARYTEFEPVPGVSFAGMPLSRAPKWTWNAGYTYTHELGEGAILAANVRTRFSSRYDLTDLATRIHFYQPSFTKTDVSLTYTAANEAWNVQLYARNLENELSLTFARRAAGAEAAFSDPRTFGVRVGFKY